MLVYKFDVLKALNEVGITFTSVRESHLFSQATMVRFKHGDTGISLETLNRLCCILEMQPRDIIKYVETEEETKEIYSKIPR